MSRLLKVLVGVMGIAGAASPASAQTCDRACLRTMLDQYLAAVIKHLGAAVSLFRVPATSHYTMLEQWRPGSELLTRFRSLLAA